MSIIAPPAIDLPVTTSAGDVEHRPTLRHGALSMALRSGRVLAGGGVLLSVVFVCIATLPWTLNGNPAPYEQPIVGASRMKPHFLSDDTSAALVKRIAPSGWFGYDSLGRSLLARCLLGGTISLAVGVAAATISVFLGVTVGLVAGYRGGWVDAVLMRTVDVLYGLPYILLVILFKIAFETPLNNGVNAWNFVAVVLLGIGLLALLISSSLDAAKRRIAAFVVLILVALDIASLATQWPASRATGHLVRLQPATSNLVVLFSAIGLVSWLTMARVVRGQVLSLRSQPFIEACRAMGLPARRIFLRHMLPNLVGPISVYATLTVPAAILQESFLSFLGVGVNPPLPTWGSLASDAVQSLSPIKFYWWMLLFPCALLALSLLSLNFLGDGLRDVFDPKREAAKI